MRCVGDFPRASPPHTHTQYAGMTDPQYFLRNNVYMCFSGRFCVLLDLTRDRYLSVDKSNMQLIGPSIFGWQCVESEQTSDLLASTEALAFTQTLIDSGLLTTDPSNPQPARPPRVAPPIRTLGSHANSESHISITRAAPFLLACLYADQCLRRRPIANVVRAIRNRRVRHALAAPSQDEDRLAHLTSEFTAARLFYPRPYLCLFDSLALLNFLSFYKIFPTWVFGVHAEPFKAHCWLQQGDIVLHDTLERIVTFTPIMAA
jgi:transglutaminase superfamily protein